MVYKSNKERLIAAEAKLSALLRNVSAAVKSADLRSEADLKNQVLRAANELNAIEGELLRGLK